MVFLLACSGIIGAVAYCSKANQANAAQSNYEETNYFNYNGRTLKSEEDERAMQSAWREIAEAEAEEGQSKLKEKLMNAQQTLLQLMREYPIAEIPRELVEHATRIDAQLRPLLLAKDALGKGDQKVGEKAANVDDGNKSNGENGDETILRSSWELVDEAKQAGDQDKLNETFRASKELENQVISRAEDEVHLLEKKLELRTMGRGTNETNKEEITTSTTALQGNDEHLFAERDIKV